MRSGAIVCLLAVLLVQVFSLRASSPAVAANPPSIVVVMVDDMDARMIDDLPGLQEMLVKRELSFSSFYVAAPVCCPSRAAFLRGQYPHNTGVYANGAPQGGVGAFRNNGNEQSNVATWLQDAGYRTALVGKYLNDYEDEAKRVPRGWNTWFAYVGKGKYTNYLISDKDKIREYGKHKEETTQALPDRCRLSEGRAVHHLNPNRPALLSLSLPLSAARACHPCRSPQEEASSPWSGAACSLLRRSRYERQAGLLAQSSQPQPPGDQEHRPPLRQAVARHVRCRGHDRRHSGRAGAHGPG